MTLIQKLVRRPRSLLLWRINFQLHLWVGLVLTLYLIVIGLSGSILVFRVELERLAGVRAWPASHVPSARMTPDDVVAAVRSAYPRQRVLAIMVPTRDEPYFLTTVQGLGRRQLIRTDPQSGELQPVPAHRRSWLDFVGDLHTTLLVGRYGRIANGLGAAFLLAINITGIVVWWPGVKLWVRGLVVDWKRNWRRVNYDLHRAVGFWALSILSFWAISGIYFGWPAEVISLVNKLSPLVSSQPPSVRLQPYVNASVGTPDLQILIAVAERIDPGTTLAGVNFPYSRRAPFEVLMRRTDAPGREYTDILYFDPRDGRHLQTWRYGVNQSLGDWFLWLQVPLHFGTYWGLAFKVIWALAGLTVPLLAVTGVVMYWNRVLRHVRSA